MACNVEFLKMRRQSDYAGIERLSEVLEKTRGIIYIGTDIRRPIQFHQLFSNTA
jgi:hypothetical protein